MAKKTPKGKLVIAGPGAGKTHNMVDSIINALPYVSPCRYLAVITYTNSATNNIRKRLSKRITLPENLFIGTMHSFLNRFVVIPLASHGDEPVANDKLFLQCSIDNVFKKVKQVKNIRIDDAKKAAQLKARIKEQLNVKGYITFDQTLSIAKQCLSKSSIARIVGNRLQYLFVDEFQDSGNDIYNIIESIRKNGKTKIYCVGDPEQYIQSFDSSIKAFKNIPILKVAEGSGFEIELNHNNYRSSERIVSFLNNFNGRIFAGEKFEQKAISRKMEQPIENGPNIFFIPLDTAVKPIISDFYKICDSLFITIANRCIIAKRNEVINRIAAALDNHYMNPKRSANVSPIKAIEDTLLSTLQLSQTKFCEHYETDLNGLRKIALKIFKAIHIGKITNENTFGLFVRDELKLTMKEGLPVKVENLKFDFTNSMQSDTVTLANIHTMKGLESEAVLAIAKTEEELLLWLETDHEERDKMRGNEKTDYPRLGYVAFSRAEKLLCIACLEKVSPSTLAIIENLDVQKYKN